MTSESNKIIVKVGNKSKLKFSHSNVFRVITSQELVKTASKYSDCHIVVVENIDKDEQDAVREFAREFKNKNENNSVLFFIPDNDDITSGVADELDYNIYLTLESLYNAIYELYGINVSTFISDKKKYNSIDINDSLAEGMTDIFGSTVDDDDNVPEITEVLNSIDNEVVSEDTPGQTDENIEVAQDVIETSNDRYELKHTNDENNTEDSGLATSNEEVNKLKMQLRDAQYEYSVLLKDMQGANSRIVSLEKLVKTLKEENDAVLNRFNAIVDTSSILEDPITLTEYEELKSTINNLESKIKELTSSLDSSNSTISDKNTEIQELEDKIVKITEQLDTTKQALDNINSQVESGEIHEEIIAEFESKIKSIDFENQSLKAEASSTKEKLDATASQLDDELFVRLETYNILVSTINEIININNKLISCELNNSELTNKINELNEKVVKDTNTITEQLNTIAELENKVATVDSRIALSNQYAEAEKAKLLNQISELETKLTITTQQLNQKESQYNQLVSTSGMDENGANILVETNKTLEQVTKTLREQLATISRELEVVKKRDAENQSALKQYQGQCKQLTDTIKNMASAGAGSAATFVSAESLMKNIVYTGQAQIIPVFGSGSFGITTMAMSLTHKLCTTSKVLYMDFDLVAPKADSWFAKMPICQRVPGINRNDRRMSALGIFYEMGVQAFIANIDNIIEKCDRTKGGGIDYMSGVYYKVDNMKVTTADYSALFNFLSTRYQYIVVDMGRLGSSDINDQLIKIISEIAYKSVVVTTCDRFETRDFRTKLLDTKIDLNKVAWLLNMCDTTNIDDKIKSNVSPAKFGMLIKDVNMYGIREKFTRNKLNKDKLDLFINSVLFTGGR